MCESCDRADEAPRAGIDRRLVIAGALAAGLSPLLPKVAGAQSFGGAQELDEPPTTMTTTAEGTDGGGVATNDYAFLPPRPAAERHVRDIMFPILPNGSQKATWSDTYLAPRSGGRKHEGQDLMAPKMLKVLACVSGTIVELRHQSSGNSLYLKGDDGWYYCYLHLNNDDPGTDNGRNQFKYAFAPGMAVGKRVLKGDHIAYNGDSGNAEASGSHVHFEIRMPNAKWYNAAAVNPKYSLDAADPARVRPKVADAAFAPLPNAQAFAKQQVNDFLGIQPTAAFLASATTDLEGGVVGLDQYIESMLTHSGAVNITAPLIRLYLGYFLRKPDYGGLDYWIRKCRAGTSVDAASSTFAGGSEFIRRYGNLDNRAFLVQIYNNLFGRNPDAGGLDYWKRRLDAGARRGWVMRQLCESSEYKRKTDARVRVIQVHIAMVRHMPSDSEYQRWSDWDAALDTGLRDLAKYLRTGDEYAARF